MATDNNEYYVIKRISDGSYYYNDGCWYKMNKINDLFDYSCGLNKPKRVEYKTRQYAEFVADSEWEYDVKVIKVTNWKNKFLQLKEEKEKIKSDSDENRFCPGDIWQFVCEYEAKNCEANVGDFVEVFPCDGNKLASNQWVKAVITTKLVQDWPVNATDGMKLIKRGQNNA